MTGRVFLQAVVLRRGWAKPATHISFLAFGPETGTLVVILLCAFQVSFSVAQVAPADKGIVVIRLEADGLIIIQQRALQLAVDAAHMSSFMEKAGIVRLKADGFGVRAHPFIKIAKAKPSFGSQFLQAR